VKFAAFVVSGAVVLAACGGSKDGRTPSGARASCSEDADCMVTNEGSGCCPACPDVPRAIPKFAYEQRKNRCAAVDCPPASDRIECSQVEPVEAYVARCKKGVCIAEKR